MVGVTALMTSSAPLTVTFAQTNQTGGQYCEPGDYQCHVDYALQDVKKENNTGAARHYELAAANVPQNDTDLAMHYDQAAVSLYYGNTTDYETHSQEAKSAEK
jgi:lipopolysaccharide export system protein LptC